MFEHEYLLKQPLFFLFIAFSLFLSLGYYWGRRRNKNIFLSAFNELVEIVKPDEQKFTNIGGTIGYHANLFIKKKGPVSQVDATITMLPRQSLLYMPISKLIMRHDRLFVTLYLTRTPSGEGHLIEKKYAAFRGPKIINADMLNREEIRWGDLDFILYHENLKIRDQLAKLMKDLPAPGNLRHIALIPREKKGFIFAIPKMKEVGKDFGPVYRWLQKILTV
ncbi:MAG TPA: hypothetical protein PLR20_12345 [Syntrophales bacterium]|nr:hypothetical protein [Syntrophales bacterium]HOX93728.1 hypothetical protein [Syntrophales bacterium]HPI57073.1 hypothetical protein [Syntrophales bacterium]HPN23797.1 hypothetical protein [Syntrophales bacterium]HQM30132.1 hypothetical protein [Syntrophales bacterium]